MCAACGEPLNESVIIVDGEGKPLLKSCPNCSERDGRHVYFKYEDFGFRMMGEHRRVQSWCAPCRSRQPAPEPAMRC